MIRLIICIIFLDFEAICSESINADSILTIKQTDLNSQTSHFVYRNLENRQAFVRNKRSMHDDQKVVLINPENAAVLVLEDFNDTSLFESRWIEKQNIRIENEATNESSKSQRNKRQVSEESTTALPNRSSDSPNNGTDRYIASLLLFKFRYDKYFIHFILLK